MRKNTLIVLALLIGIGASAQNADNGYIYKPKSQELYNAIAHMDSVYFNAYNSCDMDTQAAILADSIEFYHDASGLTTSKKDLLAALKANICGKVTRVLVKGSIEVYPLPNFGAVEIGLHKFINHQEGDSMSPPEKFICIWRLQNGKWQMYRVISTHGGSSN